MDIVEKLMPATEGVGSWLRNLGELKLLEELNPKAVGDMEG